MTTSKIIGLTGPAGSGKDTIADILQAEAGAGRLAFADALRADIARGFGVDVSLLTQRHTKEVPTDALALARCNNGAFTLHIGMLHFAGQPIHEVLGEPRSPRQIMQWWGTDFVRAEEPLHWVQRARAAIRRAQLARPAQPIVITDVRFADEAALVRELGGVLWQVHRIGCEVAQGAHQSEVTGEQFAPDHVIYNWLDIDYLRAQVREAWAASAHEGKAQ